MNDWGVVVVGMGYYVVVGCLFIAMAWRYRQGMRKAMRENHEYAMRVLDENIVLRNENRQLRKHLQDRDQ